MSDPYLIVVTDGLTAGQIDALYTATDYPGFVATPPTALDSTGTPGQYAYSADGNTRYDCIATDTWRASILTADVPL